MTEVGDDTAAPGSLVAGIVVLGLLLTALATWAAWHADRGTEDRLLQTQTRQAATVLSTAIGNIEQPMAAALDVQRALGPEGGATPFTDRFAPIVGPDKMFVSASLWRSQGQQLVLDHGAQVGTPGMDADGTEIQTFLQRALAGTTPVVQRVEVGERTYIAFALADPRTGFVVYAERAIPADRRSPVDRDSAFSELDYAIYLGAGTDTAAMSTTDVDPASLPLSGLTSRASIPFGDTTLTLVTSPRHHLGGALSQRLPWLLLVGGLLLTSVVALVALRLVRSRRRALRDNATIAELYQRVDVLFDAQRALFVRLQRALLPHVIPDLLGYDVAAEYVAGTEGIDIGGDWYSVIALGEEEFAFVVGDVSGRGVDAVAEMARARFTLRAYLFDGDAPHVALEKCSRQFDISTDGHLVTVLVARGNRRTGELTLANAGHPAPLLIAGETATFVSAPVGIPLGTGACSYEPVTITMPPGSTLLAYTDGLVERRDEDIDDGLDRLSRASLQVASQPLEEVIAHLLTEVKKADSADDVAVLALRRDSGERIRLVAGLRAPADARAFVAEQLREAVDGALVDDVTLVVSELVTNAVRAGATDIELALEVTPDRVVVRVDDDADGWPTMTPADDQAVQGRGLHIVDRVTDEWHVDGREGGKSVSAVWLRDT